MAEAAQETAAAVVVPALAVSYSRLGPESFTFDMQVNSVPAIVAAGVGVGVGLGAVSLAAIYFSDGATAQLIRGAFARAFGAGREDRDIGDINRGSLFVKLYCYTAQSFLDFLENYESGKVKECLKKELSNIGIEVDELSLEIKNIKEANEHKQKLRETELSEDVDTEQNFLTKLTKADESVKDGQTALHRAVQSGKEAAINLLINRGAEIHAVRHRFGQRRPPLTELIQGILKRYPDGGQILKELIQNADDAGATEVNFLYDDQSYGCEFLENPELAQFQGPSLYCHNNATFEEEDWEGIQNLMRSNKKDGPLKVGRFGIGFNSVYHITDLPGIVSGDTVGFLDPHEAYFTDERGRRGVSGKRYFFDENLLEHNSKDQFAPFHGMFDCNLNDPAGYSGTLFRFPLRISPSDLSKKKYTEEMVDRLFTSLKEEASLLLLFLKNVSSIKIHTRNKVGEVNCVFTVEIGGSTKDEVKQKRQEFLRGATEPTITESSYIMNVQVTCNSPTKCYPWLVVNQVGSNLPRISELAQELNLLPWVGMAFSLHIEREATSSGRIFCFLPLPPDVDCQTGLPVHVHGYFGLADNRRGLMWPGAECQNTSTAEWNELLLENVAIEVYCKLLEVLLHDRLSTGINEKRRSQLVYSSLPNRAEIQGHWKVLLDPLFQKLSRENQKLFYAQQSSGTSWVSLHEGVLDRLPKSATRDAILRTLLQSTQVIINAVPDHVLTIIETFYHSPNLVTPAYIRSVLKAEDISISNEDKLLLLGFILEDDPTYDLEGVPLLPLANGEIIKFSAHVHSHSPSKSIFVPSASCKATLLPNTSHRFLCQNIPGRAKEKLYAMAANDTCTKSPTQLVWLNKEIVLENLRSSLPSQWFSGSEKVQWIPGNSAHPPESWLEEIWSWINSCFPDSLCMFKGIPLIDLSPPTTSSKFGGVLSQNIPLIASSTQEKWLGILSKNSKFIFACDVSGNQLPREVVNMLTATRCIVLPSQPPCLRHQDINSYIAPATPVGVALLLSNTSLQSAKEYLLGCSSSERGALQEFFTRFPGNVTSSQRSILLQLPLFDTLNGSTAAVQSNNQTLCAAAPQFTLPCGFKLHRGDQIISSAEPKSCQLLQMLGVKIMNPAEVFLQFLFPDIEVQSVYSLTEISTVMLWILSQMMTLAANCKKFLVELKLLPFVETGEGLLKKPCELYDPSDQLLLELFSNEQNKFPEKTYRVAHVILYLKELGLRKRSRVTACDLLQVAQGIASSALSPLLTRKAQALVKMINNDPGYLHQTVDGGTLKSVLLRLTWLPRALRPPNGSRFPEFLPWYNDTAPFFSPTELRDRTQATLIGSTMPVLELDLGDFLAKEIGLGSDPPMKKVIAQLKIAAQEWSNQRQKKATAQFQEMLLGIYQYLSRFSTIAVSEAIKEASLKHWIWHGNGFCSPEQVALEKDYPLDLRPQLFILPDDFNDEGSLTTFFLQHGVRRKFLEEDIVSVLLALKKKHEESSLELTSGDVERDLKLCRSILEWLVESERTLSETSRAKLFVPVQSSENKLVLEHYEKCTYCDHDWLRRGGSELDIPDDYQLIHDFVPAKIAIYLGVPALSSCLLSAEQLDFEQTGPYEPITTRINNILKEYKEGAGVFKELIQNADDAGASKVRFLVDWREGPKKTLLSPGMAKCQGPALWAYNDGVFTNKDFENINKMAKATKVRELAKIGRFGLGFNAVYHLTDVPSFVSREYFVVFDPNVHHLQNHIKDKSRPGIRINLAKNPRPLSSFEDQFQPYQDIFDCNTRSRECKKFHYQGTLFRFPFRTGQSEICQRVYDEEKVQEMIDTMRKSASLLLLFTQHVNAVELYELAKDNSPQRMQLVLSIHKSNEITRSPFINECSDWWTGKLNGNPVSTSPSRSEIVEITVSETKSGSSSEKQASQVKEVWLVRCCMGKGSSSRLALEEGQEQGLLPCAGAATKLSKSGKGKAANTNDAEAMIPESVTGEAFCFLPLSISTGFPVHINAHFAITSNRRGIWERSTSDLVQPIEVRWNETLMEDALAIAYIQLLKDVKQRFPDTICCLEHLLPSYDLHSGTWETLLRSVYAKIVHDSLALFWSNGKWINIHNGYILGKDLREVPQVIEALSFLNEHVLEVSEKVFLALEKSGHKEILKRRTLTLVRFFEDFFLPNIGKFNQVLRDPIVRLGLECVRRGNSQLASLFEQNAFVLSDDGQLKKPCELYDQNEDPLPELFYEETGKFPSQDYTKGNLLSTLKELGLRTKDMVTANELLKVAEIVSWATDSPLYVAKTRALAKILQDNPEYLHGNADECTTLKDQLAHLKWLPRAKTPPESCRYPEIMPWFTSDVPFFAPVDLCDQSQALLIGSAMPVLDEEIPGSFLNEELGVTGELPVQQLVAQLKVAIQVSSNQQSKETSKFREMLVAIYSHLSEISYEVLSQTISDAALQQWIWHGSGFCSPEQVALEKDYPLDLRPQLFILPDDFNDEGSLTTFFLQHGVRRKFLEEDIVSVLLALKKKHEESSLELTSGDVERDLKLCRSILEWLVESERTLSETSRAKLFVPVQSSENKLVLEHYEKCTYCDHDWLRRGGSELDIPDDYQLIHDFVPAKIAVYLGVPALSSCLLSAEQLDFEQTGPYEPITTRINNILKEYKEGAGVFKELIQNADDAGASKVRFLVDWREGPKKTLLSPGMAKCQGPALWAYNDGVFTDKDFENINKLARATKVRELAKIGRFGLGFNAVYHLTDVPSFVSREYFVVFDPNVHHLQNHIKDKSRPGIRINLAKNPRPLSSFEDQFQPYQDVFDCNTRSRVGKKFHYQGTLFRFPFRTGQSEICQRVYDEEKVQEMIDTLRKSASLLLLYTQHVNEVELYELAKDNSPQRMQLVLSIHKSNEITRSPFINECSVWWTGRLNGNAVSTSSPSRSEIVEITVNEKKSGSLSEKQPSKVREVWLVSCCMGTGSSSRLALEEGKEQGLLPCAGAATKLSKPPGKAASTNDAEAMIPESVAGEAFCFLPLSISTGFPVHINAFFAITSNRRGIWERTSDLVQPIEVRWNESLMEDALATAYTQLLEDAKVRFPDANHCLQNVWPSYDLHSSTWETLVRNVYAKIVHDSLALFWSHGKWMDIHNGYILGEDLLEVPQVVQSLSFLNENVFNVSEKVCLAFKKSGHDEILKRRTLTLVRFFEDFFLPNIGKFNRDLRDPIIMCGLECVRRGNSQLASLFKENAFVLSDDGRLKKPSELYDRNEDPLPQLFYQETGKFPCEVYAKENLLFILKELGLRDKDMVTANELLKVAQSVSLSTDSPPFVAKVRALVRIIRDNPERLHHNADGSSTLKDQLAHIKWLPRAKTPPESSRYPETMPWFSADAAFFAPVDLFAKSQALLIGSSLPVLDEELPGGFFEELKMTGELPIQQVVAQLKTAVQISSSQQSKETIKFREMLVAIYRHLSEVPHEVTSRTIDNAALRQWIWHGSGFCSPTRIAIEKNFALDLQPHLYFLPEDFKPLTEFFLRNGVRENFSQEDIVSVLATIKTTHETCAPDAITTKMTEHDMNLCRFILEWLVEGEETLSKDLQEKVFVPVQTTKHKLVLEPCKNCTYCDHNWLRQGGSELDIPGNYHLINDSIPNKTARLLGVPALSTCLVSAETLGFEQTGPYEPLTTRLSNILSEYKEDVSIFKELIQNADDAGASKVRFLIDWRQGPKEKLLSPGMAQCQGPALWAYNDGVFTDKDFENINKLAGATKVQEFAKIGRFGLGFNAVYHLTDVPSFVSREYFVVFDPNVHHLQNHIKDKSRPGIRINLAKNPRPLSSFEDQFQPFQDVFDCNTLHQDGENFHFEGTLFRFPFRTLVQASKSEISENTYDQKQVKRLMDTLRESASLLLLYTQRVSKVDLYELDKDQKPRAMQLVLSVKKNVRQDVHVGSDATIYESPFINECSDWWSGILKTSESASPISSRSEVVTVQVNEMVSDLSGTQKQEQKQETWLVSSCVGTGSSKQLAMNEGRKHGLLPCAGAAAKLSSISCDETKNSALLIPEAITGQAFCFLPLSIVTSLPVHINASFAITSNRRGIWERTSSGQGQDLEVRWNESLMEDALTNAYIELLKSLKYLFEQKSLKDYFYNKLWPCFSTLQSKTWRILVKSVYGKLVNESLPLLRNGGVWLDIKSGYIIGDKLRKVPKVTEAMDVLGENLFDLPKEVCVTLKECGLGDFVEEKTLTLIRFFQEFFFRHIRKLPKEIRDPIVCFGLDYILNGNNELSLLFQDNSCIPCSADGVHLAKPSKLINPQTPAAVLFTTEDHRLPVGEDFQTSHRILALEDLGMIKDLPWDMILERAESIEANGARNYSQVLERSRNLVKYLNKRLVEFPEDEVKATLQKIKFLPFLHKPPSRYRMPWKGSECERFSFCAPEEVFMSKDEELVGSCSLILDDSDSSGCGKMEDKVKQLLGFVRRRPSNDLVLEQLDTTISTWSHSRKTWSSLDKDSQKELITNVKKICKRIYKHLDGFLSRLLREDKNSNGVKEISEKLAQKTWIFVDEIFTASKQIAIRWKGEGSPFLFGLPTEYSEYRSLLEVTNVKENFDESDFLNAIKSLKSRKRAAALNVQELNIAVTFTNGLKNAKEEFFKTNSDNFFLPDKNRVLAKADELTINNTPWLNDREGDRYVHKDITSDLAFKLGAKSLLQRTTDKYSQSLGTAFGQHEKLTDRLKSTLKSYLCDSGILKELVQNADDAQASEIHFIHDTRTLPCKRVFQKNAKEIQGPALCVYNDRPFSEDDLQGIQKLGIGSKSDDPEKTGHFGIGFNAVYHLTDCPSFISDDNTLCVLDPHCRYAPKATHEFPGRQYRPIDHAFREYFPDALVGYLGQHFKLKNATMFRLPLRNNERAKNSLISNVDGIEEISTLVHEFRAEAKRSLLFLNHVKRISISTIDKENRLVREYEVSSITDEKDVSKLQELLHHRKKYQDQSTVKIPWKGVTYPMVLSDSSGSIEHWLVHQCFGTRHPSDDYFEIPDGRDYRLLPRGGVAALLESNRVSSPHLKPRYMAYCYLPLPGFTSLPVHVNGHFALDPARRALWKDTDETKPLTKWNMMIQTSVLAPGYASLILAARNYLPHCERHQEDKTLLFFPSKVTAEVGLFWYHQLFPVSVDSKDQWHVLAVAVHRFLTETKAPVLPVVVKDEPEPADITHQELRKIPRRIRGWYPVQNVFFVDESQTPKAPLQTLLQINLPVLRHTPLTIQRAFDQAETVTRLVCPKTVTEALLDFSSESCECHIGDLPTKVEDTAVGTARNVEKLISFCKGVKDFAKHLPGLPLLLTADGILRVFSQGNEVYCSQFSDLFPQRKSQFIHPELVACLCNVKQDENDKSPPALLDLFTTALATFLPDVLPENMKGANEHLEFPENDFSEKWLKRLWLCLQNHAIPEQPERPLDALSDWPIIPTKSKKLVTVAHAKTILDMTETGKEFGAEKKVRECLNKLGCPSLDTSITLPKKEVSTLSYFQSFFKVISSQSSTATPVTDLYVGHPNSVADILQVLDFMVRTRSLDEKRLSAEDILEILKYVQEEYETLQPKSNCNRILKSLPFYKAINNSHYRLSSYMKYAIVPVGVPTQEIDELQRQTGCLFLHSDALPILATLLEGLGAGAERSTSAFYTEYILPRFSNFSKEVQVKHLTYIRDKVYPSLLDENKMNTFVDVLRNARCIPKSDGQLACACEFYSPANTVFRMMFEESSGRFPPSPFSDTEWLKFLEIIGLHSDVNQELFLTFADTVAGVGNHAPLDETNRRRSKELLNYLFSNHHLHEASFLFKLSSVKFIASKTVEENLLSLHGQHQCNKENDHPPFLQFSGSVLWENRTLVWSSAPLLPEWLKPEIRCNKILCERESLFKQLRVTNPTSDMVISQLQNISGFLANRSRKEEALRHPEVLKKIMKPIYKFLQTATKCPKKDLSDNCSTLCHTLQRRLTTAPCILVENGTFLVRGDQLSFKIPFGKSLQPFMYEVPREYGELEHFLKRIGATEEFTASQLAKVFKTMKDRLQRKIMSPEYEKKASNAMCLFFESLLKETKRDERESSVACLTELYLPSMDKRLIKSNELLCQVPTRFMSIVVKLSYHALYSLEECGLKREHEAKYFQALPEKLRPRPFNKVIKERLDESCLDKTCQLCNEDSNCDFIEKHRKILKSKEFQDGITRLLKYQKNSSSLTEDEQEISSRLGSTNVEIQCMEVIKIHLVHGETNEPLEDSTLQRSCYTVKKGDRWDLYIQHGKFQLHTFLSKAINKILHWSLDDRSLLFLSDVLSCASPSAIAKVLDDHDIPRNVAEERLKLGQEVPIVFHYLLQQNPLFIFHEGELVAYAIEMRENDDGGNEDAALVEYDDDGEGRTFVKYVLVRVIKCVSSGEDLSNYDFKARYLIDLGCETKDVSVLDLYKFYHDDPDDNTVRDLVPFTGDSSQKPTSLDEAKLEILEALRAAWRLPPELRKKAIKRLYLRWHPDKNPNNRAFATEMMAFLLSEVKRLNEEEQRLAQSPDHFDYERMCRSHDSRASRERETFCNYRSNTSYSGSGFGFSGGSFPSTETYTNPNPREARRWVEQSESDLRAAQFLLTASPPFHALVCFLSHQIVEKSLKAALYAKCGLSSDQLHTHDVYSLANRVTSLSRWRSSNLTNLVLVVANFYLPTRYPNQQPFPIVPVNAFDNSKSTRALQSATEVLSQVKAFIAL